MVHGDVGTWVERSVHTIMPHTDLRTRVWQAAVAGGGMSELSGQASGSGRAMPVVPEAEQPDPLLTVFEVRHRPMFLGFRARSLPQHLPRFHAGVGSCWRKNAWHRCSVVTGSCRRNTRTTLCARR